MEDNVLYKVKEGSLADVASDKIVDSTVKVLDSKKASNIKVLKIDSKTIIADYFVICTGNSNTQIKSLADEVEYQLGVGGVPFIKLEGSESNEWKIIDCKDIIVHIFSQEARTFYNLDRLWSDCEEIDINSIIAKREDI